MKYLPGLFRAELGSQFSISFFAAMEQIDSKFFVNPPPPQARLTKREREREPSPKPEQSPSEDQVSEQQQEIAQLQVGVAPPPLSEGF